MHRVIRIFLVAASLFICNPSVAAPLAIPERVATLAPVSIEDIRSSIDKLDQVIGSYPPKIASEVQRELVYAHWSNTLQQAWHAEAAAPESEAAIALLADLYRQGHNLDVKESGLRASQTISKCLAAFPASVACHYTATYFYLSVNPKFAPKGEASLVWLREYNRPKIDLNVERGFIFAYLYQGRQVEALKQLDYFLTLDPAATWAREFREGLIKGKAGFIHN